MMHNFLNTEGTETGSGVPQKLSDLCVWHLILNHEKTRKNTKNIYAFAIKS